MSSIENKSRVTTGLMYDLAGLVHYTRKDSDKWKGPGMAIRKEKSKF